MIDKKYIFEIYLYLNNFLFIFNFKILKKIVLFDFLF